MEHFSETTAAYEGGTKRSWFSGTCHSTVPTFQECETSTLCWKHFEKWGKLLKKRRHIQINLQIKTTHVYKLHV